MANRPKLTGGEPINIEKAIVSQYNKSFQVQFNI